MSRGWKMLVVAVVLVAGAGGAAWAVFGEDLRYRHALERYDDERGEPNVYVDLPDGQAQLALGSPDAHRIVVQWRDPDGRGWTAPETVWTDRRNEAFENTVRYGGGTVAVLQSYTPDVHSDSDSDLVTVGIVCRDLTCAATGDPGYGGEAQVTPDGAVAYLGQDEEGVHLWTEDDAIVSAPWSGHPGFGEESSPSEPLLVPDGTLRLVASRPAVRACRFELLVSERASATFTAATEATVPVRGRRVESDCGSHLMSWSSDWVEVNPDDPRSDRFWFAREEGGWSQTQEDPSGLALVDRGRGCCDTVVSGFVHWNDVAYGSPDGGRTVVVQTHLLGEEAWSEPVRLPGATAGHRCSWLEGYEVGEEGYAIVMTCHSGAVEDEFTGDAYAVVASPDLREWESTFVEGVRRPPASDGDRLIVGNTVWTPEDGFQSR